MTKNLYCDPISLAQKLIQFNTVNGLNPEEPCITYIKDLLGDNGIESKIIALDEKRPNLLAKIEGTGDGTIPPLMLTGHADVVPVSGQNWSEDPFSGIIKEGYLWGRGAIDMKGELAMFISAMIQIKQDKIQLPFDVVLLVVSDEEGDSNYGMKWLTEAHPEIFQGIKYALGEIGGFSLTVSGKKFYPIMIAEKQFVQLKITAKGQGGHASMAHGKSAMELMAEAVLKLSQNRLPVRITPEVDYMIRAMGAGLGGFAGKALKLLLRPALTDKILNVLGETGSLFDPLLHNKLTVTIINGGDAINVVPSEVSCQVDMRMVPGCSIEEGISDIRKLIGDNYEIQVMIFDKGAEGTDMTLYDTMAEIIQEKDKDAVPVPFVLAAVTDGRYLARVGVQTYGFTPMNLPQDYEFTTLSHNADERVPVDALTFGAETIFQYITDKYASAL